MADLHPNTHAVQHKQYTQGHVPVPTQSIKATKYDFNLTANGGLEMNLKNLKKPGLTLKQLSVGVAFATQTAVSGAT